MEVERLQERYRSGTGAGNALQSEIKDIEIESFSNMLMEKVPMLMEKIS
jgi:hypothetical protein